MTSQFGGRLDRAAGGAICQILETGGSALVGLGTYNAWTGAPAAGALTVGSLALLASQYGCNYDPEGTPTVPLGAANYSGCDEATLNSLQINDSEDRQYLRNIRKHISTVPTAPAPNGTPQIVTTYIDGDGVQQQTVREASRQPLRGYVEGEGVCSHTSNDKPTPEFPEYEYTDEETGCTLIVETLGFGSDGDTGASPFFRIKPSEQTVRNGGGVIGGCNFAPTIYYGGPGGGDGDGGGGGGGNGPRGPVNVPDPGDGVDPFGNPEWLRYIKQALAGAAANLLADLVRDLFEQPYPGTTYSLRSHCEADSEGKQKVTVRKVPPAKGLEAALERLDAIHQLLQPLKDYKQPICPIEPTEKKGDYRTISFVSDEQSPEGRNNLRKRFRYRSQSGNDLGAVIEHWKDFVWSAGPVCVKHTGSDLGSPQVWASSAAEGKRVIQHAGAEAGVDPNQDGQWTVSGSDNPRYGMPGTMRVNSKGGYYWITARLEPDGRPLVGEV